MSIQRNHLFFALLSAFSSLTFFLFLPVNHYAQAAVTPAIFGGIIDKDEEGKQISLPFFVLAEPVMKEIYVVDSKTRVMIYTSDFFPIYTLDGEDGIISPQGIDVDAEGNLYIIQNALDTRVPKNKISVYNACLKFDHDIIIEGFEGDDIFTPKRLSRDKNGNIYIAGLGYTGVVVFDSNERFMDMIIPEEEGKNVSIIDVTLDHRGRIYLVSEDMGRIYVYNEERKFLFKFGQKGGSSGKLSRPRSIDIDKYNGTIYVVDYMRHTILAYDENGKFIFEFGGMGWGQGWFQHPMALSVDSEGSVIVADFFNDRVQIFRLR